MATRSCGGRGTSASAMAGSSSLSDDGVGRLKSGVARASTSGRDIVRAQHRAPRTLLVAVRFAIEQAKSCDINQTVRRRLQDGVAPDLARGRAAGILLVGRLAGPALICLLVCTAARAGARLDRLLWGRPAESCAVTSSSVPRSIDATAPVKTVHRKGPRV